MVGGRVSAGSPLLESMGVTLLRAGREGGLVKEGAQGRPVLEGSD